MPNQPPVHLDLQQSDPADFVATSELIRPQTQDYLFRLIEWLAYYIHQAAPLSKSGGSNSQEGQTWTYATEGGISLEIQDLQNSRTLRVQTTGLTSSSHQAVIEQVVRGIIVAGFTHQGTIESPILGTTGNKEFLAYFIKSK